MQYNNRKLNFNLIFQFRIFSRTLLRPQSLLIMVFVRVPIVDSVGVVVLTTTVIIAIIYTI